MDLLIQLPPAMLLSLSTADKAHAMSEGEWAWLLGACLKRLVSGKVGYGSQCISISCYWLAFCAEGCLDQTALDRLHFSVLLLPLAGCHRLRYAFAPTLRILSQLCLQLCTSKALR